MKNPFTQTTNVDIAHGHRSYQKFIGRSASNLPRIAMVLSMVVVPLGLISLVWLIPNLNWIIGIVASIIALPTGIGLAYVIEGMTVQSCNRWLSGSKELKTLNEKNYELVDKLAEMQRQLPSTKGDNNIRELNNEIEKVNSKKAGIERKMVGERWNIGRNAVAAIGTSSVSFFSGGILWHLLFSFVPLTLFSDNLQITTEIALALLVPWVLITSELGKEETERTIKESISSAHYLLEAQEQDMIEYGVRELSEHQRTRLKSISAHNPVIEEVANIQAMKTYSMLALGEGKERQFDLLMKEAESRKAQQVAIDEAQSQKLIGSYIEGSATTVPLNEEQQPVLRVLRNEAPAPPTIAERDTRAKENRNIVEGLCDKYGLERVLNNRTMFVQESGLKRPTFHRILKQVEQARGKDVSNGA